VKREWGRNREGVKEIEDIEKDGEKKEERERVR